MLLSALYVLWYCTAHFNAVAMSLWKVLLSVVEDGYGDTERS
jgi:hypothetical protein